MQRHQNVAPQQSNAWLNGGSVSAQVLRSPPLQLQLVLEARPAPWLIPSSIFHKVQFDSIDVCIYSVGPLIFEHQNQRVASRYPASCWMEAPFSCGLNQKLRQLPGYQNERVKQHEHGTKCKVNVSKIQGLPIHDQVTTT